MQKEQEFQVIMLPTELDKDGAIWKFDYSPKLIPSQGKIISEIPLREFHLYFITKKNKIELEPNDIIKSGDWFIHDKDVLLCDAVTEDGRLKTLRFPHITIKAENSYKIFACTDKEITPNAIIPKSYVDFYVDKANDSGVAFDYVTLGLIKGWGKGSLEDAPYYLKTNANNEVIIVAEKPHTITISIKQANELYFLGREDKIASEKNGAYIDNSEEWIKKCKNEKDQYFTKDKLEQIVYDAMKYAYGMGLSRDGVGGREGVKRWIKKYQDENK